MKMQLGFNTRGNNQTSGRTTLAVNLGKLRSSPGSTSRIFNYCNKNSTDLNSTFKCVFNIPDYTPKPFVYLDGKYQIAVGDNKFAISKDFGLTWEQKLNFAGLNLRTVAVSNDGRYILAGGLNTPLFYSNDGGLTFSQKYSSTFYWFEIKMSKSGQYQTAIGPANTVYISNNYGKTFDERTIQFIGASRSYLAMSYDGKYQSITLANGIIQNIYISNDYGNNWTEIDLTIPPLSFSGYIQGIAMSGNGQIQMAVSNGGQILKSTDYGNTWNYIFTISSSDLYFISMSETGQYQLIPAYGGNIWISNDYGETFTNNLNIDGMTQSSFGVKGWYPCGVSPIGKYQTVCDYDLGYIYTSSDYGQNWFVRLSSEQANWWGFFIG